MEYMQNGMKIMQRAYMRENRCGKHEGNNERSKKLKSIAKVRKRKVGIEHAVRRNTCVFRSKRFLVA